MKIPISRYTLPQWMEQEKKHLWKTQWLLVSHNTQLQFSGDIEVVSIAGIEIIVVLSDVGYKAFYNSCPHRGGLLVTENCKQQQYIHCPIHNWKFSLTGDPIDIPEPQPKEPLGLLKVHCDVALGFIWVCFAEDPEPLSEFLSETCDWFENYGMEHLRCKSALHCSLNANWKTSCDLHNEIYHLQSLHSSTLGLINDTGAKFTLGTKHAHILLPMFERSNRKISDKAIRKAKEVYQKMGVGKEVNKATLSIQIAMQEKRPLSLTQLTDLHIVYVFPNVQIKMRQNEIVVLRHLPDKSDPNECVVSQYRLQVQPLQKPFQSEVVSLGDRRLGNDIIIDMRAAEHQQLGLQGNIEGTMNLFKPDLIIAHSHKQFDSLGLTDNDGL
jgi:phenylpropionate dioxygenase-like ring-hydroxylating dioxygenase large terminal subunit